MKRSGPWQHHLDDRLRRALRAVADSVEPGADGLDQIRARIRAWPTAPPGSSRRLGPSVEPIAWHRWLRPAAALATAIFVVFAGYLAIAAMPRVIGQSSGNAHAVSGGRQAAVAHGPGSTAPRAGSAHPVVRHRHSSSPSDHQHHGARAPSHSPPSANPVPSSSAMPSASPAPSGSATPSASSSPSGSGTPSASPSPTPSCSPSPSPTPTASHTHPKKPNCHRQHHRSGR